MQYAIVDVEKLKQYYPHWEHCRKSNDGTMAIIHKEIWDNYRPVEEDLAATPMVMSLVEGEEPQEPPYPYPLASGDEINAMDEFTSKDETTLG